MANEVNITITADDLSGPGFTSAMGRMLAMKAAAKALGDEMKGITLNVDPSKMNVALLMLKSRLQALGIADIADVNIPVGKLTTQLMILKRLIKQAGISDMLDVNVDDATLAAQLAKMRALSGDIPIGFDVNAGAIAAIAAQIEALKHLNIQIPVIGPTQNISDKFSIQGIAAAEAELVSLDELLKETQTAAAGAGGRGGIGGAAVAAAAAGGSFNRFGAYLGQNITLWGGLTHGVGLWHIALDGAIETTIAVGLATAALGVGLYGLSAAAIDVYNHLNAVDSVNDALVGIKGGGGIPPLTHAIGQLQDEMAPTALELYGGGLNFINSQTGVLGKTMMGVGGVLEGWVANIDIWAKSQSGLGQILQSGVGFLEQFGSILGDIGLALDNLIKADPGTAHFLLDVIQGFAKALDVITSIPAPILEAALALHSIYLWGGLAATALQKVATATGLTALAEKMGLITVDADTAEKSLLGLSKVEFGGILIGAAAVGFLAYQLTQADTATKRFINNVNTNLSKMSAGQALPQISVDIGQLNQKIQQLPSHLYDMNTALNANAVSLTDLVGEEFKARSVTQAVSDAGKILTDVWHGLIGPAENVNSQFKRSADLSAYNGEINKLIFSAGNLGHEMGVLGKAGYTGAESLGLMSLAGVKTSDSFAVMQQKVENLIEGYKMMGEQGGLLTNAVNAVTLSEDLQQSKMGNLTAAYTTFVGLVTGSETALVNFAQGLNTQATDAKAAGASMNGLNAASLSLRSTYTQNINSAVAFYNALIEQSAAAGMGAKGYALLSSAGKDLVGTLLAGAKGSAANTAQLYALAQVAGYNGPDSFKALSLWVGNTTGDEAKLNNITGKLTIASAGLTTDVNNLANAISQNLNQAMAQAIFQAGGGQKTFDKFADAVLHAKGNADLMHSSAQALATQLITTTGNTRLAENEFITFAERLDLSRQAAQRLWDTLNENPRNVTTTLHLAGVGEISLKGSGAYIQGESGHIQAYAGGTTGAAPGWGIVGENGPELVNFSGGEAVMPSVPGYAGGTPGADMAWMNSVSKDWGGKFDVGVANMFTSGVTKAFANALEKAENKATLSAHAGPGGGDPLANAMLAYHTYHPSQAQWIAWNNVAMAESGWNQFADNPSSGAYGIAQALPPTKYPFAGQAAGGSNPMAQISWMWSYMKSVYGGPIGAWDHESAFHWYDNGGWLPPGPSLAFNGTGHPERVGNGAQSMEIILSIDESFQKVTGLTTQQLKNIKYTVRTQGGGDVQKAFGNG